MRKMLYTIWFLGSLLHVGCTKDNYIDTGISNGRYHGNLMQYMASNSYDWDSTILLVRHAGDDIVRLFDHKASVLRKECLSDRVFRQSHASATFHDTTPGRDQPPVDNRIPTNADESNDS